MPVRLHRANSLHIPWELTKYRWKKPDVERFAQEILDRCSHGKASAHVGGQTLPTSDVIYQLFDFCIASETEFSAQTSLLADALIGSKCSEPVGRR